MEIIYMKLQDILDLINQADSIEDFAIKNLLKLAVSDDGRFILNYSEQTLGTPKSWTSHYCRGLTLAGAAHNYRIIAKSFDRFYNLTEEPEYLKDAKQIDFDQPFEVQFKFDGSLILQYLYEGKVCVNTRGSFAQSHISALTKESWEEVFNRCNRSLLEKNLLEFPDCTYIWELCTPYNQVVEYHAESFAKCLGIVRQDGTEIRGHFEGQTYQCQNKDEILELLNTLKPTEEGFVIAQWDEETQTYLRKKLKTKTWLELSHIKESALCSRSKLWEVVLKGEKDEVASVFGHIKDQMDQMWNQYQGILKEANAEYELVRNIENQKDFAIEIKDSKYKGCYFSVRAGKNTLIESIQTFIKANL